MVKNENLINLVNNKKPIELVQELKDEYKVPSYEEFMERYERDEKVEDSYQDEINGYDEIKVQRGYGPCEYSGCPYSTSFVVEIFIEGNSRK